MQTLLGELFLESIPHALSFLSIRYNHVGSISKQRQLLTLSQQELWLLVQKETVEDGCQQSVKRMIKHIYQHNLWIIIVAKIEHELFF